ncbi:MAG: hypothetical protein AB7F19_06095 [Candidatus Babeliales bacterium]
MKKLLLVSLICAQTLYSATLKVQNSSNDSVIVTLFNDKGEGVGSRIVDNNAPQTLNSGLQPVKKITWVQSKVLIPVKSMGIAAVPRTSQDESTYALHVDISPLSLSPKLVILKNGNYKYYPKKDDVKQGTARTLSAIAKEAKDLVGALNINNN